MGTIEIQAELRNKSAAEMNHPGPRFQVNAGWAGADERMKQGVHPSLSICCPEDIFAVLQSGEYFPLCLAIVGQAGDLALKTNKLCPRGVLVFLKPVREYQAW